MPLCDGGREGGKGSHNTVGVMEKLVLYLFSYVSRGEGHVGRGEGGRGGTPSR